MSGVERYFPEGDMERSDDGGWVRYSEHKAVEDERDGERFAKEDLDSSAELLARERNEFEEEANREQARAEAAEARLNSVAEEIEKRLAEIEAESVRSDWDLGERSAFRAIAAQLLRTSAPPPPNQSKSVQAFGTAIPSPEAEEERCGDCGGPAPCDCTADEGREP